MSTPVVIGAVPAIQFFNYNGKLAVGYKLFIYLAGTTTKAVTYSDYTGDTPNPDPIVLNNLGQSPGIFVTGQESLKYVLAPPNDTDPPTDPLWSIDGISAAQVVMGSIASQDSDNVNITGGTVAVDTLTSTGMTTIGGLAFTGQASNSGVQVGTLLNSPAPGNPAVWLGVTVNGSPGVVPWWPATSELWDDNGILAINNFMGGYPSSPLGLLPGSLWNNNGSVSVVPTTTPNPGAPPVYFGQITAAELLALTGANLLLTNPSNLGQLWNNNGTVSIVETNEVILLLNDGGVLVVSDAADYPSSPTSLPAGSLWSNAGGAPAGVVTVVPGVTPNPFAPPVYFSAVTAAQLLTLGGGNLPITNPGAGSGQLWNNGGVVSIA